MLFFQSTTPHRWRRLRSEELDEFIFACMAGGDRVSSKSPSPSLSVGARMQLLAGRRTGKSLASLTSASGALSPPVGDFWVCDRCGHRARWDGPPPDRPKPPTDLIRARCAVFMRGSVNSALGSPVLEGNPIPECDLMFVQSVMEA